ncbi:MAG: glycosyltransferase family 4 protein [Patescibacteria group bacterium]|nr:glycosyltransferase family 4 protein [Patescibacteria group bacterium]
MAKILLVTHNLNLEGAPLFLFNLGKGLKKIGYEVEVLSPSSGPLKRAFSKESLKPFIFYFKSEKANLEGKEKDYDAIIVNTISGYKFIQKTGDSAKKKIAWVLHESERDVYFNLFSDLNPELFGKVDKVVFSSQATRDVYEDLNTSGNFEIINTVGDRKVIDEFVEKNEKRIVKKKRGFADEDFLVMTIGTICLRKGQMEFTQAAIEILKKVKNSNLKFVMVGGGRGYEIEKTIRKTIMQSGFGDQIIIIDETKDIFDYYFISDIFVLNSYIEAFPLSILEAMAFGLPIIATDVYGIPEQIEDGKEGLLIMAGDVKGLENKIMYLLKNKNEAKKLGMNARNKIENEFQFDEMIKRYDKLISETANG